MGALMRDADDIKALMSGGWISRQPEAFRQSLLDIVTWHRVAAGTTVNRAGDEAGGLWGLARGQIDISSALSTSDSPVADIDLPGRWGGIGPVFDFPRAADGTARTESVIAHAPLPKLNAMLAQRPEWWRCVGELAVALAFRYGTATGDLLIRGSRRRCIAVLLRLADCRHLDPAAPPTIVLSHGDLAEAANMSRHPAGETLRELHVLGYIALGYRQVTILDAAGLRAMVDG